MSYGPRTETVLTKDGRDIMDQVAYRTLIVFRSFEIDGAVLDMNVSRTTTYRRLRALDQTIGGRTFEDGKITPLGLELLEHMERYAGLLREQLDHLWKKPTLTCDEMVLQDDKLLLI